ncbi:hypothetical protein QE152_g40152 [Popillia japonica]|uniref:Uncharacterized protein n=1 Tax=Popillia japonica TaxID=7064 RepID=A0AAW1HSR9_POPJA
MVLCDASGEGDKEEEKRESRISAIAEKVDKKGGITTKKRENILFVYLRRLAPDYVGVVIFRLASKKRENILFVYLRRLAPDYVGVVIFRLASPLFSSKHDRFGILAGTITASFS